MTRHFSIFVILCFVLLIGIPAHAQTLLYPTGYSNPQKIENNASTNTVQLLKAPDTAVPIANQLIATSAAQTLQQQYATKYPAQIAATQRTAAPVTPLPVKPSSMTAIQNNQVTQTAPVTTSPTLPVQTRLMTDSTPVKIQEQADAYRKSSMLKNYYNEFGARYWYSEGKISYDVENPKISRLEYESDGGHSLELYTRLHSPSTNFLFKGLVGLGISKDGDNQDLDFSGASTISDTSSEQSTGNFAYAEADLGYKLNFLSTKRATTNLLLGYGYFKDNMKEKGITCNQASPFGCAGPGDMPLPSDVAVLKNEAQWNMLRLGAETILKPNDRLTLRLEAVGVPYAAFDNDDSHYLRDDLGTEVPNFVDSGDGYGMQLEAFLEYQITKRWGVGLGARYWKLWADQTETEVGAPVTLGTENSYNWQHERYGALIETKYSF